MQTERTDSRSSSGEENFNRVQYLLECTSTAQSTINTHNRYTIQLHDEPTDAAVLQINPRAKPLTAWPLRSSHQVHEPRG